MRDRRGVPLLESNRSQAYVIGHCSAANTRPSRLNQIEDETIGETLPELSMSKRPGCSAHTAAKTSTTLSRDPVGRAKAVLFKLGALISPCSMTRPSGRSKNPAFVKAAPKFDHELENSETVTSELFEVAYTTGATEIDDSAALALPVFQHM